MKNILKPILCSMLAGVMTLSAFAGCSGTKSTGKFDSDNFTVKNDFSGFNDSSYDDEDEDSYSYDYDSEDVYESEFESETERITERITEPETTEFVIPPLEERQEPCSYCDCKGYYDCFSCGGKGYNDFGVGPIDCITCNSEGVVDCNLCNQTGYRTMYYDQYGNQVEPYIYYQAWMEVLNGNSGDYSSLYDDIYDDTYDDFGGGAAGGTNKCTSCVNGWQTCPSCHGDGKLYRSHNAPNYGGGGSSYQTSSKCYACGGNRQVRCTVCGGDGYY